MVKKRVCIFTDGSCLGNPGHGGWGALLRYKDTEKQLYGGVKETTTNNRMELLAAIKALDSLKEPCFVTLTTDSQYVTDGITKSIINWKRRNWITKGRTPVKNVDLWKRLEVSAARHAVDWRWVRGHSGDADNELADLLACQGAEEAKKEAQALRSPRPLNESSCFAPDCIGTLMPITFPNQQVELKFK